MHFFLRFFIVLLLAVQPVSSFAKMSSSFRPSISSSSGGYAKSTFTRPPSAPSFGSSSSGGYTKSGPSNALGAKSLGAGDAAVNRSLSGSALKNFDRPVVTPSPSSASPNSYDQGTRYTRPSVNVGSDHGYVPSNAPSSYGSSSYGSAYAPPRSWVPPSYVPANSSSNWLMWYYVLESADLNARNAWFRNHMNGSDYGAWRQNADAMAQADPRLKARLDDLDHGLSVPVQNTTSSMGEGDMSTGFLSRLFIWVVVLVFIGAVVYMIYRVISGVRSSKLDVVKSVVSKKLGSTQKAEPSHVKFRIGQSVVPDQTPFILVSGKSDLEAPVDTTITKIGVIDGDFGRFSRLYLKKNSFFIVHEDDTGSRVDECRYFSQIDEVFPSSSSEWAFWIDDEEGVIGDAHFRTKDGIEYVRQWGGSGTRHIDPIVVEEVIRDERSSSVTVKHRQMLYARDLGLSDSTAEYLLVETYETEGKASVVLYRGIDVDSSTLSII